MKCPRCGRFMRDEGSYFADTSEYDEFWVCSHPKCEAIRVEEEQAIARQMGDMADWWREQERLGLPPREGSQ